MPGLESFQGYATRYGLPQALYPDRHSTYRGKGAPTVADELAGRARPQSQFERAVAEVGVTILHAHSPQAKGRVERFFRTVQDRVLKEWRLAGIRTIPPTLSWSDGLGPGAVSENAAHRAARWHGGL